MASSEEAVPSSPSTPVVAEGDDDMTEELFSWLHEHRSDFPYPWTDPLILDELNVTRIRVHKDRILEVSQHVLPLEVPGWVRPSDVAPLIGRDTVLSMISSMLNPTPATVEDDSVCQIAEHHPGEAIHLSPAPPMAQDCCRLCLILGKKAAATRRAAGVAARRTRKRSA